MKKVQLEIACFNLESAIIAQQNGADRVELCANMKNGGTTPSFEMTKAAREVLTIELYIMIRPRAGNFSYSNSELEEMKSAIQMFKKLQVDGFVFGILNPDGSFNAKQNRDLVQLANSLPCTFHRAFDEISNRDESLESIIKCGFKTILTSGQGNNVVEGIAVLTHLIEKANDRIIIMPGGGLRAANSVLLKEKTKAIFYHSSAITDSSDIANQLEIQSIKANLEVIGK
ncbi:copper homeostasis protein CutC [Flavobacterium sp. LB2R40]|uniref:copper homeostasis protein CutC n=1 Tax=unclassified Flavobacterium TaxID=196869 RepID=UPI003AB05576